MIRTSRLIQLLAATSLTVPACATAVDDGDSPANERDKAFDALQQKAGAPVTMELNEAGLTRVITMTPRFSVPGHATDPVLAATNFLSANHDLFQLDAEDARNFVVARADIDTPRNLSHITLQRVFSGIPVFQGAITVHMDGGNGVFRAMGDEFYKVTAPTNREVLAPDQAALAAGRAFGVPLTLSPVASEAQGAVYTADTALDPVRVDRKIFQFADDDNRFAYQVALSWLDQQKQQQYRLALIDAQSGEMLGDFDLVNTFTGRVFSVAAQPTANMTVDTRTVVSFDGNATASPQGWVGTARNTVGNNAVACTDLNANNNCTGETQPVANASDSFDFPFNPTQNAQGFASAAVTNAFYLVNDFHDRTYAYGFNEASGNFQTNNFGKGGAQNDPVNVDAQDGSGTNNANFATPPDGSRPRMQMFLFTITGGATEDGDFDPSVIYHENSHGLSNRLVGGGSTACLGGTQSGGMGEGWGDFMGASFANNPVVGAYVTGNSTVGIRDASMAASPFTYNDLRNGRTEVHDVGEIWAAVLWDVRKALGATVTEQLVVAGMKLTPCNPTMLAARDGIISADANLNGGANRCALWTAFAGRQMGTGASSPNHNSTTQVVVSTAVPADCGGGGGGTTVFTDDFETDKGWTTNAGGTDTATTGQWQRANPDATTSGGTQQVGTTPSGVNDLVTGAAAGASAGANDVDGGTTSVQSPAITVPATGTTTLSFKWYFAHLNNSSTADFFRVQVVGATTTTVFQQLGSTAQVNGAFATASANISAFAGQSVRVLISCADAAGASLVECGVDDVVVTNQ